MTGLLFVTATEATHKTINLALTYLRDWEYGDGDNNFKLVTTRNAYELARPKGNRSRRVDSTSTPVLRDIDNAWSGASLEDIEFYCIDLDRSQDNGDKTCILGERFIEWESDPITYPEKFKKFRLPWDEAYLTWCNLDISNTSFEDYADEDEGDENGWFKYNSVSDGPDLSDENRQKRSDEIDKLRQDGSV